MSNIVIRKKNEDSHLGRWCDWHSERVLLSCKAGHEVTVIERQPGAALETSFANAGEVSRLLSAVGRSWRAFEGDQMVDDGTQPIGEFARAQILRCGVGCFRC